MAADPDPACRLPDQPAECGIQPRPVPLSAGATRQCEPALPEDSQRGTGITGEQWESELRQWIGKHGRSGKW